MRFIVLFVGTTRLTNATNNGGASYCFRLCIMGFASLKNNNGRRKKLVTLWYHGDYENCRKSCQSGAHDT